MTKQKRIQNVAMMQHTRKTVSDLKQAQKYLRDLAQVPRRRQASAHTENGELVLANRGAAEDETKLPDELQHASLEGYVGDCILLQ